MRMMKILLFVIWNFCGSGQIRSGQIIARLHNFLLDVHLWQRQKPYLLCKPVWWAKKYRMCGTSVAYMCTEIFIQPSLRCSQTFILPAYRRRRVLYAPQSTGSPEILLEIHAVWQSPSKQFVAFAASKAQVWRNLCAHLGGRHQTQ